MNDARLARLANSVKIKYRYPLSRLMSEFEGVLNERTGRIGE